MSCTRGSQKGRRSGQKRRKRKIGEELKKQEADKIKLTQAVIEQSASDVADSQAQDLEKPRHSRS